MPSTYRNIHLIYNPAAGRLQRANGALMPRVRQALEALGSRVEPAPTSAPGDATRLAREAPGKGADLVLVAGGDGTINEALNGIVRTQVPFGIVPLGTANVLATELGLPREPEKAAASVAEWIPERISVGLLTPAGAEPRYFLLMAGVGLDAHIVVNVDLELKKKLGRLAYWIGGFGQLGQQFPQFEVTFEGTTIRSSFTLAARVRNYGGDLAIARNACLLDDYFEMVAFEGADSFRYLKYLTGVLANLLDTMDGVSIRKVREAVFRAAAGEEIFVQVDGELAGRLPARVEIVPDAVTLLMPASFREKFAGCGGRRNGQP